MSRERRPFLSSAMKKCINKAIDDWQKTQSTCRDYFVAVSKRGETSDEEFYPKLEEHYRVRNLLTKYILWTRERRDPDNKYQTRLLVSLKTELELLDDQTESFALLEHQMNLEKAKLHEEDRAASEEPGGDEYQGSSKQSCVSESAKEVEATGQQVDKRTDEAKDGDAASHGERSAEEH